MVDGFLKNTYQLWSTFLSEALYLKKCAYFLKIFNLPTGGAENFIRK